MTSRKYHDFGGDPLAYYKTNYNGMTRGRLAKENKTLYLWLKENGSLKFVPKVHVENDEKYLAIYHEKYDGMSRGQLAVIDHWLYDRLRDNKQLSLVPKLNEIGFDPKRYINNGLESSMEKLFSDSNITTDNVLHGLAFFMKEYKIGQGKVEEFVANAANMASKNHTRLPERIKTYKDYYSFVAFLVEKEQHPDLDSVLSNGLRSNFEKSYADCLKIINSL